MEINTKKIQQILRLAASIFFMPVFFVAFCLLYDPFDILEFYSLGSLSYSFHLTMLGCIILLTTFAARFLMDRFSKIYEFHLPQYILWCAAELFVCACFMALYTQLFTNYDDGWFRSLAICLKYSFLILCYPTLFIALAWRLRQQENQEEPADDSLVKLYDEHKRLKLTISPAAILYVRAESNYVYIYFLERNKPKEFVLRN